MRLRRVAGVYAVTGVGLGLTLLALAAGWSLFMDKPPGGSFPAMVVVSGFVAAASGGIVLSAVVGLHLENGKRAALGSALGFLALAAAFTGTFTAGFAMGRDGSLVVPHLLLAGLCLAAVPSALVGGAAAKLSSPWL